MQRLTLTDEDVADIDDVVDQICKLYDDIEDPELISRAGRFSRLLPERLGDFAEFFRLQEPDAVACISGYPVDESGIGPTPTHWKAGAAEGRTFRHEVFFLLCASMLGDAFGWATQQEGRIMHNVLPIEGDELEEIGSNSVRPLSWHTEDAFHPARGDYVALMCMKNPDDVLTHLCPLRELDLSDVDVDCFFEPEFTVLPDNSHQSSGELEPTGHAEVDKLRARSFALVERWNRAPERRPLFWGERSDPYWSLDPYHMVTDTWPERHRSNFEALCDKIDAAMAGYRLQPGDCVFIDNSRTVHGRASFNPRYDGSDRWLKRLNITRNLRASRAWRLTPDSRVIY